MKDRWQLRILRTQPVQEVADREGHCFLVQRIQSPMGFALESSDGNERFIGRARDVLTFRANLGLLRIRQQFKRFWGQRLARFEERDSCDTHRVDLEIESELLRVPAHLVEESLALGLEFLAKLRALLLIPIAFEQAWNIATEPDDQFFEVRRQLRATTCR